MALARFIRRLRKKPKHVRDNVALITAGSFTAVVTMVWLYLAPINMNTDTDSAAQSESLPFFSQMRDSISSQTASIKEAFSSESSEDIVDTTLPTDENQAASTSTTSPYTLTNENRQNLRTSSSASSTSSTSHSQAPAASVETTENRRIVRIATTTSSTTTQSQ